MVYTHMGIIYKICNLYATDEDRDDLKQEIIYQLWKSYPTYRGDSKFQSWMYRVALNTAINLTSKPGILTDSPKAPEAAYDPGDEYQLSEEIKILHKAIAFLKKIDKAIILLWLEENSYEEIAETIGITVKNVSVRIVRAKSRLAEIMQKLQ